MRNMSDEELDGLFKEAAENHHVLHDAEAWQDMALRLDKEANPAGPSGSSSTWSVAKWVIPAAIVAASAWFLLTNQNTDTQKAATEVSANEQQEAAGIKNQAPGPAEKQNVAGTSERESAVDSEMQATKREPSVQGKKTTAGNLKKPSESEVPSSERETVPPAKPEEHPANIPVADSRENVAGEASPATPGEKVGGVRTEVQDQIPAAEEPGKEEVAIEEAPVKEDTVILETKEFKGEQNDDTRIPGRLFVKLEFSPDLTSIDYFTPGRMGINFGGSIEYYPFRHWSVQGGLIWARKIYSTHDAESYNNLSYSVEIGAVDGDCRVMDIPVNIYYHFSPGRAFSFAVGAGLSSYMMMHEDYTYWTKPGNGHGPYPYYKHIEHENNEWMKLLNFSIMVERQLARRWSAQLEPFVKAPLAGVGDGKVSLVSAGAFLNLKYRIK